MTSTVYCVGGGPSLVGFDWDLLRGRRVIAVNRAYETCPEAEAVYFSDLRFWLWHREGLIEHPGRKITGAKYVDHLDVEKWEITGARWLDVRPRRIRSGNSSGYAAINVAYHLLAGQKSKRIILLGYDMQFRDGKTHWHSGHIIDMRERVFEKMIPYFGGLAEILSDFGVDVVNACPDSRIEAFQRTELDDPQIWE